MENLNILQYPTPEVVPGMRVKATHFEQVFSWVSAKAADGMQISLPDQTFGLIRTNKQHTAPNFDLTIEGETLLLRKFGLLFPNGMLATGAEKITPIISFPLTKLQAGTYDIVLMLDPNKSKAFGEPDATEIPFRHPYRTPLCLLDVVPSGTLDFSQTPVGIKIASLSYKQDSFRFLETYIPPCVHLGAYNILWKRYLAYCQNWSQFCEYSIEILKKTSANDPSPVIMSLRKLADEVGKYVHQMRMPFQALGSAGNPKDMLSFCTGLASLFHFYLETLKNEAELLELFKRHVKSLPGYDEFQRQGFRDVVKSAAMLTYEPLDLERSLEVLDVFFDEVLTTWRRLSEASQLLYVPVDSSKMFIR